MMKKYIKLLLTMILLLGFIVSCSDDYLDVDPINKLSESDFWKTHEDAISGTNAVYDILQWMYARDWNSFYLAKTFPSDESNTGGGSKNDQPPYQELDVFAYGSSNTVITAVWQSCYYGIYRANKVVDNVKQTNDLTKRLVAEAKCLRAYYYLELVTLYGGVPIILHELTPSEYSQPRATKAAVYAQIESDLKEAIDVLPVKSAYSDVDKYRVTKGAAQALLGKAYLYQEKWSDATTTFELIIASKEYALVPSNKYAKLFLKEQELKDESIFEVMFSSEGGYTWGTFVWGGSRQMENNINQQLSGPRGDYYKGGSSSVIAGWGFNYPTKSMYDAFKAVNDSIRRPATLFSVAELKAMGGDWTDATNSAWGFEGYIRVKYGTILDETNTSPTAVPEVNYGTNIRVIRYADVLLMNAEAYYRAGDETKCKNNLNLIRQRAKLSDITTTGNDLFNSIVNERKLELAFEGSRFVDLVRWGMAADTLASKGFVKGKNELFPIPKFEMDNNKLIGNQNPNY